MKGRITFILFLLFFGWLGIIVKAAIVQVFPNKKLSQLQKKQFSRNITLNARRGTILDKNGIELAITISAYSLYADPKLINKPFLTAKKLGKFLKTDYRSIYKKIKNNKIRFIWIKRQLGFKQRKEILSWKNRGLAFIQEPKRVYPHDHMLSQLIGFVGRSGSGLEGLEFQYESYLEGENRKIQLRRDAKGRPLLVNGRVLANKPDGYDVHLTVDYDLQYKLELELFRTVRKFSADSAVGIILNAKTSAVLAIANVPTFNSNYPSLFSAQQRRNKAITDIFEPGSTMKTFVVAGALAKGIYKPTSQIFCEEGKFKIGNRLVREANNKHKFGNLSMQEILAKSSNIGTTKIALKMGEEKLRKTLQDFGFGKRTGIDFPGEARGILQKLPWRKHLVSNISFGHGIAATPLQVASAYAAIANGGLLKKPYIVQSIKTTTGTEIKKYKPEVIRRVLEEEQAATMRLMLLEATSSRGTGSNARIHGYPVAGKTGTAQKVNTRGGGYLKGSYISSFAGFVPANDPQFVIYILIDNPRLKYYGSEVAAPVFAKVASFAVLKLGLPPVILSESDILGTGKDRSPATRYKIRAEKKGIVPNILGLSLRESLRILRGKNIQVSISGSGIVKSTSPDPGKNIVKNQILNIKLQ